MKCEICGSTESIVVCDHCRCYFCKAHSHDMSVVLKGKPNLTRLFSAESQLLCHSCFTVKFYRVVHLAPIRDISSVLVEILPDKANFSDELLNMSIFLPSAGKPLADRVVAVSAGRDL